MANVLFKRGLLSALPKTYSDGTFYVTTDERAIYLDISNEKRIRLGDFQEYASWDEISKLSSENISTTALYYAAQENVLAKFNGENWTQINPDTYVKEVTFSVSDITDDTATFNIGITHSGANTQTPADSLTITAGANVKFEKDMSDNLKIVAVDEKATKAGHYTPADQDKNWEVENKFVSKVVTDANGHIVDVVSSDLPTQTDYSIESLDVSATGATVSEGNSGVLKVAIKQKNGTLKEDTLNVIGEGATRVYVTSEGGDVTASTIHIKSTDTSVTSAENHYTPSEDVNSVITIEDKKVISAISRDSKGHIVGVTARTENDVTSVDHTLSQASSDLPDAGTGVGGKVTVNTTVKTTNTPDGISDNFILQAGSNVAIAQTSDNVITISSLDQKTTESGHYDPKDANVHAELTAALTAEKGKVISGISVDSKGHIKSVSTVAAGQVTEIDVAAEQTDEKTASLKTTITNNTGSTPSDFISLIAGDNVKSLVVSENKDSVTINVLDEKVTSAANHYKATSADEGVDFINATLEGKDSAVATGTSIAVVTGVQIDKAGHVVGVASEHIKDTHANLTSIVIDQNPPSDSDEPASGFTFTIKDSDGTTIADTLDPAIALHGGLSPVKFVDGVATLDVYSTGEVDSKITEAISASGAMVFKGGVAPGSLPATFEGGDTYIATADGEYVISIDGNEKIYAELGDLFVAKYDSDDEKATATAANWYYIPSGDDKTSIKVLSDSTTGVGFDLVKGAEGAVTGKVIFSDESESNIKPVVIAEAENHAKICFNMEWGSF